MKFLPGVVILILFFSIFWCIDVFFFAFALIYFPHSVSGSNRHMDACTSKSVWSLLIIQCFPHGGQMVLLIFQTDTAFWDLIWSYDCCMCVYPCVFLRLNSISLSSEGPSCYVCVCGFFSCLCVFFQHFFKICITYLSLVVKWLNRNIMMWLYFTVFSGKEKNSCFLH